MSTRPPEIEQLSAALAKAQKIVIIQADNPDGDSLASALALEQILHEMGKDPLLYCGVGIPAHLRYLPGWDRVSKDLPAQFDASIIVDCSSLSLLATAEKSGHLPWITSKPFIIIDHHKVKPDIPASVYYYQPAVATGQILYELATSLQWPLNAQAKNLITISILSDSLGLMSEATTARSIQIVGELVEQGVKLAELDDARRELMRKSPELVRYKGVLLQRIEYFADNRIAAVTIPWEEIEQYSHAYNPSMLVMDDMRFSEGTDVAIAFKVYKDGKITAKIRCNYKKGIGADLAEHFGGGGHTYASGFKITDGRPFNEVKSECIKVATELLDKLEQEQE